MPAKKKPSMAQALGTEGAGGLLSFFERAALESREALPGEELQVRDLPLELVDHNPHQARQSFDPRTLEELAQSVREHGVIEPIVVRPTGARYEIVAGERRYRASLMAGRTAIPARIMELDKAQASIVTALENLQREDLDIEDEARQFAYLLEATGVSQRRLAEMLGKDHVYISRRVKLLKRPDLMQQYRAGRVKLHEAVAQVDAMPGDGPGDDDLELIEREDLSGYIVSRGNSSGSTVTVKDAPFRWRPAMQFRNWLDRTRPEAIPPDERASFKAQIAEIRTKLDEWEQALEVTSDE